MTVVGFVKLKYYSEANVGGRLLKITRKHVLTHECQRKNITKFILIVAVGEFTVQAKKDWVIALKCANSRLV